MFFGKKIADAFLITNPENIRWISGFSGSFGLVIFSDTEKILITDARYFSALNLGPGWKKREYTSDFSIRYGEKFKGHFLLEESIALAKKKRIKKMFPHVYFSSVSGYWENFRREKKSVEIHAIKTAQTQVDTHLIPFLKTRLHEGVTEKKLAFELEFHLRSGGKFDLSFPIIIAFGENSAIPHHTPGERKLLSGDNILVDLGLKYQSYCSDMTRNFCFRFIDSEFDHHYQKLLSVQQLVCEKFLPGAKTKDLDFFARKNLGDREKYFTHSLGHGVGLEIHEAPTLNQKSAEKLRKGEVVTCEPGLYFPKKFGIRIEDMLYITEKNPEILTKTPRDLIVFP